MATGISSRSFISVLKRSGVVSEVELNRALAVIQERGELSLDNPQALAKAMIADGVITRWQAEKLLQGKHKGFSLGPYRLLDMLGKGGMGAVYLAEHTLMRRRCAIKVLPTKNIGSRSYLERFYREAQAVAAMDHKNIVRAYDVNQAKVGDQDVHFLAMEFVEGSDLQRMVDEGGVLAYSQAAEYVRQSAEGLAHAHEANMVHRDIKPANLLVNTRGIVKILDLGLAKFYDDQQETASLTVAHNETVLGTADYLAPEQAVDSHNTDHRADIYSLGCTFYYLLTGHPPFCEGSVANRLLHHQMKPPPPIQDDRPDAPESLLVIIDRMMAKKREERYQSAKDVADDLAVWLVENGNEEWRERNPELVRKVGDSFRADTKVVSGALVDTAELDLKADDDLSLAPIEGSETPKESPLVAEPAARNVSDSELDLAPHEAPKPSKSDAPLKSGSGIKSGSKAKLPQVRAVEPLVELAPLAPLEPARATPAPVDLQPMAAPDLAPLDALQSLEPLASASAGAQNAALSGPHATAAAAQKKKDDSFPIPMPWIIAIASIAVVVVLAVIVMMIASSGRNDQTSAVSPGPGAAAPHQPTGAPPLETGPPDSAAPTAASDVVTHSGAAPAPSVPTETVPTEKRTPNVGANAPSEAAQAKTAAASAPAPELATSAPKQLVISPPPETSAPAPPPSTTIDETPSSEPAPGRSPKELWATIDTISLDLIVPKFLTQQTIGLRDAVVKKLEKFKIESNAPAVLQIDYRVEPPKDVTKAPYTVAIKLTVTDKSGRTTEIWTDEKSGSGTLVNFVGGMRDDAATLVSKMINTLGRP